jgi:O-antigen/teichoic acid export membrane protein
MEDAGEPDAVGSPGLKHSVTRGLAMSTLNTIVGRAGTFIAGLILARVLTPEDYGMFAVALIVLTGLLSFNELSVQMAIVRWPVNPRLIAPTVFTMTLVVSISLYIMTWFLAPYLSSALGSPGSEGLIRGLSLGVIFDALTTVPSAGMNRDFAQGRRFALDFSMFLVTTLTTVALAINGDGATALVIGRVVGGLLGVVLFQIFGTLNVWPGWNQKYFRELLSFGLPLAGTNTLQFAMANMGLAIVGAVLGPTELGFYLLASNLANWPVNIVTTTLGRVSFAWFSRLDEGPAGRGAAFVKALPLTLTVVLPVCLGMSLLAEPIIDILYGDKWSHAAAALQFLALAAGATVLIGLCQDLLAADNRGHWNMFIQIAWFAVFLPTLFIGATLWGIGGAAAVTAVVSWFAAIPAFLIGVAKRGASPRAMVSVSIRPLVAASALFSVVLLIVLGLEGDLKLLLISVPAGAVIYVTIMWPLLRDAARLTRSDEPPAL